MGHISDHDLDRYHLGMVEEPELTTIEEHLLWCKECIERAEDRIRDDEEKAFVDAGHVTTEDLERYHLGHLKIGPLVAVRKHTATCPECADRLLAVERFIMLVRHGVVRGGYHRDVLG